MLSLVSTARLRALEDRATRAETLNHGLRERASAAEANSRSADALLHTLLAGLLPRVPRGRTFDAGAMDRLRASYQASEQPDGHDAADEGTATPAVPPATVSLEVAKAIRTYTVDARERVAAFSLASRMVRDGASDPEIIARVRRGDS